MLELICGSFLIGAMGALVSDYIYFVRILLIDRSVGAPFRLIGDIVSWICGSVSVILSSYFFSNGMIRWTTVAAVAGGIIVYRFTLRRAAVRLFKLLNRAMRALIAIIGAPIARILIFVIKKFRTLGAKFRIRAHRARNGGHNNKKNVPHTPARGAGRERI